MKGESASVRLLQTSGSPIPCPVNERISGGKFLAEPDIGPEAPGTPFPAV